MDPLKRGRSASSLIPFPRVGRSVEAEDEDSNSRVDRLHSRSAFSNRLLYGQKRTGKSSLIPFPRVGRSDPTWGSARGTFRPQKISQCFLCFSLHFSKNFNLHSITDPPSFSVNYSTFFVSKWMEVKCRLTDSTDSVPT